MNDFIKITAQRSLPMPVTCSGVAAMGLGVCETCVAEGGVGAGLGAPPAGDAGARYLIMAGSTSGVPWKKKNNPQHHCCVNINMCLYGICITHPLWCVNWRQCIQVCHWEFNAFPLQFLINMDHPSKIRATPEGISPGLQQHTH